jgi:hypothetical protein
MILSAFEYWQYVYLNMDEKCVPYIDYENIVEGIGKIGMIMKRTNLHWIPAVIVGTVLYLRTRLSQETVSKIVEISTNSIRNLCQKLNLEKENKPKNGQPCQTIPTANTIISSISAIYVSRSCLKKLKKRKKRIVTNVEQILKSFKLRDFSTDNRTVQLNPNNDEYRDQ